MQKSILFLIIALFISADAMAQKGLGSLISPGQLASPHAEYEGISNCTECHALGGGIPDRRCLDCHDKLDARIRKGDGVHARYKDACIKCHSDHKGRSFKMISLDKDSFNHDDTGYRLEGRHADSKCEMCHKKGSGYTGLKRQCISCHKDIHKGELSRDCSQCHNIMAWNEIQKFSHDRDSKYILTGKHKEVKCVECHLNNRYRVQKFDECQTCHRDPHKNKPVCEKCHITESWKKVNIDHDKTNYPLVDKHQKVECSRCHRKGRLKGIPYKTCESSACHQDLHEGQFKEQKCEACHIVKGWKPSLFDHDSRSYTGYKLDGKHSKTDCGKCHIKGRYKPISSRCFNCHQGDDIHKKELGNQCERCHNTIDWKKSVLDHNRQTDFPLIGRHKETECEKCHENKRYRTEAKKCVDCHKDIHKGEFKEECSACHTQVDWTPRKFDHLKKTRFELKGVHNDVLCTTCHKTKGEYKRVSRNCNQCHTDPHFNQFGGYNCIKCHSESSWNPTRFDHNTIGYPLVGKHRTTECQECHKDRVYRNTSAACISCHLKEYSSAPNHVTNGYSQDCSNCHRAFGTSWPFNHRQLASGCSQCHLDDRPVSHSLNPEKYGTSCESCHKSTTLWKADHAAVKTGCSSCHLSDRPATHTANTAKYATTCESCHKYPSWTGATHPSVSTNCSSCHIADKPSSHTTNGYSNTCESCHKTTTAWTYNHAAVTTGCSSCHLNTRPSSHISDTTRYSTTCENCHKSTASWTSHTHPSVTANCSSCHLNNSNPPKPGSHSSNNWTTCESCHKSTITWSFTHPTTTFPLNHNTSPSNCTACHPGGAYKNGGGCIECHSSSGAEVHRTSSNTGCLNCHWCGRGRC